MNEPAMPDAYGVLTEPATLKIQRLLPGPIERIWAYLTDSDLRRQWLAAGEMELKAGAPFEFVWRNGELTDRPGERPAGFPEEHRMEGRIIALDPPSKLVISWGTGSEASFELEPEGNAILLTLTHRRLPDRRQTLNVAAGWHTHLDVLVARVTGAATTEPFWDGLSRRREEYDPRIPA